MYVGKGRRNYMSDIRELRRKEFDKFEQIAYNMGYRDGEIYNIVDKNFTKLSFVDEGLNKAYNIGLQDGIKYGKNGSETSSAGSINPT
jgi:hypothetical protein